jgi:hypothetical protein
MVGGGWVNDFFSGKHEEGKVQSLLDPIWRRVKINNFQLFYIYPADIIK